LSASPTPGNATRHPNVAQGVRETYIVFAVVAPRNMPAKHRCAAALNRRHHLQLGQADMPNVGGTPDRTMGAENIRDLQ
jgi:hypothetical protein